MLLPVFILALIGFGISLYTYLLEKKIKQTPDFKPACDISDAISCTKPMKSPYAHLLFVSNALLGMGFYAVIAIMAALDAKQLLLISAIGGCIVSCLLSYLLFFKIRTLCLLCVSLYIVNFLILLLMLL